MQCANLVKQQAPKDDRLLFFYLNLFGCMYDSQVRFIAYVVFYNGHVHVHIQIELKTGTLKRTTNTHAHSLAH